MPINSSTSSSKGRLTRSVVACGLVLLVGYEALVRAHLVPAGEGTSQQMANQVRLEQYQLMADPSQDVVLVGSSLMVNLQRDQKVGNVVNLAQGGGCSLTGLALLTKLSTKPKLVVVEVTPTLDRGLDASMIDQLTGTPSKLTGVFHSMLQSYSPSNVFLSILKRKTSKSEDSKINEAVRQDRVGELVKEASEPLGEKQEKETDDHLDLLVRQLNDLKTKGIPFVLVDIPGEREVDGAPNNLAFMRKARLVLDKSGFGHWLTNPVGKEYHSKDGVHMVPDEATEYRSQMLDQIKIYETFGSKP